MEPDINNNDICDITYMPELIPLLSCESKKGGINSQTLRYNP
jgi:hypothetical protein